MEQSICEHSAASQAEKNPNLAKNYGRFYDIFIGHPSVRPLRWVSPASMISLVSVCYATLMLDLIGTSAITL